MRRINLGYIIIIVLLVSVILGMSQHKIQQFVNKEAFGDNNNKICCFYAYYEKNEDYKSNFEYFLENGILDSLDYYIIINGNCSANIPKKTNIKVFNRENKGYDFGAYSYVIDKLSKQYDYYFFINTSVVGPYFREDNTYNGDWTVPFLELFDKDVKVVGTSINIYISANDKRHEKLEKKYKKKDPFSHVQSMFFCVDSEYFEHLKSINFFDEEEMNSMEFDDVIINKEIGLSQIALSNGWNINCILNGYTGVDYRKVIGDDLDPSLNYGDPYVKGTYFGKTITKEEVIFYKKYRVE